jgi:fructose-1,6-bisphosphatase I
MSRSVITLERHIIEQEREYPEATGALSNILYDLAFAAKMIAREVKMAGLVDILGGTDSRNIHDEEVQKLDVWADDVIFRALDHGGHLCCMASEERESFIPIPDRFPTGKYAVLYDPLDGSSNIDANVSIGTIFSIHRKVSDTERGDLSDCLQGGRRQVAAGYIVYGSSTMLVYSTGHGVHGFTLDPSIGEFLLSHPDIRIPRPGQRIYSVNEGNYTRWSEEQQRLVDHLKGVDGRNDRPFSSRYIGSLVADFHRNLLYGGLFMYPAARVFADVGERDILDIEPDELHQKTPLFIGTAEHIDLAERFLKVKAAAR